MRQRVEHTLPRTESTVPWKMLFPKSQFLVLFWKAASINHRVQLVRQWRQQQNVFFFDARFQKYVFEPCSWFGNWFFPLKDEKLSPGSTYSALKFFPIENGLPLKSNVEGAPRRLYLSIVHGWHMRKCKSTANNAWADKRIDLLWWNLGPLWHACWK